MSDPKTASAKPSESDKSNQPVNTAVNTQSTKPVVAGATVKSDPDHKAPSDDTPKKIVPDEGDPPPLSAQEQRELERILDGDEDAPATTIPNDESVRRLFKLLKAAGHQTPDEHIVWGIADARITVGDLRNFARLIGPPE